MIGVVIMTCNLCGNWIYLDRQDPAALTLEQTKFELWLLVELYCIQSFIFAGAFYSLCCKFKHPLL